MKPRNCSSETALLNLACNRGSRDPASSSSSSMGWASTIDSQHWNQSTRLMYLIRGILIKILALHVLWYQILGQIRRVPSTHFWKIKGQKVKLKGHQYSFLAVLRIFIRVTSTHLATAWFFKGSSSTHLWIDVEKFSAFLAKCLQLFNVKVPYQLR